MLKRLLVYVQFIIPQHLLSMVMGKFANSKQVWFKNLLIQSFINRYSVNMQEAEQEEINDYQNFNQFFTRRLKPQLRAIDPDPRSIACPVDGTVAQIGRLNKHSLLQAKNFSYDLKMLLASDDQWIGKFTNGSFATFYLAPHNYHRIHMPLDGDLKKTIFVPGKLFSVNPTTSQFIPQLFTRNERLIIFFDTQAGPMALILVGAMIVGSIQVAWMNQPVRSASISPHDYDSLPLEKGAEVGNFHLGSTVILLFSDQRIEWNKNLIEGSLIQFGKEIGKFSKE